MMKQKVMSALGWLAGATYLGQILNWCITLLVIRLLTPADYGLMAMTMMFVGFLAVVHEIGLGDAIIQKEEIDTRLLRQVFSLVLLMNLFLFSGLFVASPWIASFFEEPRLIALIRVASLQFILMALGVIPGALLERELMFKDPSIISFFSWLIGGLTTLALAYLGFGVWALVWGNLLATALIVVGLNVLRPCLYLPVLSLKGMRSVLRFGGFVTMERVLWGFYTEADIFIVGKFIGKEALGHYAVAMQMASTPITKISPLMNVIGFPAFSQVKGNLKEVAFYHLKTIRIVSLVVFPICFGISSVAPEGVSLLFGEKWMPAALPLQLIALAMPIRMLLNLNLPALLGIGRPDRSFGNSVIIAVIMVGSFCIGIQWGIIGVSMAWLCAYPVTWLIVEMRTLPLFEVGLSEYVSEIMRPLVSSVVMFAAVMGCKYVVTGSVTAVVQLGILVVLGVTVYGTLTLLTDRDSLLEVWSLFKREPAGS